MTRVEVRCTCGVLYLSSPFKHEEHRKNAYSKANNIAVRHAMGNHCEVEVNTVEEPDPVPPTPCEHGYPDRVQCITCQTEIFDRIYRSN